MISDEILEQIKADSIKEFELLSKVYRPSFYTRQIADYLKKRAQELKPGIEVYEDEYRANLIDDVYNASTSSGNIWFDIPANDPNLANNAPIILQAHMDMVVASANKAADEAIKQNGVVFENHSNGTLTSLNKQTSLGADDGIGLGLMYAILKNDNFKHGPIRFLITADEEVGMCGASYLGLTKTGEKGMPVVGYNYLINLDNPYDGEIIVSTAGAVVSLYTLQKNPETAPLPHDVNIYTMDVSGLLGGHDGIEIHHHASAARLAAETLKDIALASEFQLIEFITPDCDFHNVIQTHAIVTFATKLSLNQVQQAAGLHEGMCKNQFPDETNVKIRVENAKIPSGAEIKPISHQDSANIIRLMNTLPYGPTSWRNQSTGWVETSGNLGPVYLTIDKHESPDGKPVWDCPSFAMRSHIRSCNNDHLLKAVEDNKALAKECLGSDDLDFYQLKNILYGWPGDSNTALLDMAKDAYESKGVKWATLNVHGGLEVSWFKHFNPNLTMVSIGPEIHNVHDCSETLYIETLDGFINVVLSCIDGMKSVGK
ncbi:MAG: M20/M25/M40 family metallo-hydrolase [Mycoplasmoidaceae bacterium]